MSVLIVKKYWLLVVGALLISGCFLFAINPHENFKEILYDTLGRNIDNIPFSQIPSDKQLIGSQVLPNGNIERKYYHWRSCFYYVEFDPKTRTIVRVRFEGNENDCVINP